jgi:hypothetical protein
MFRDIKVFEILEGTNQIQRMVIARELLAHSERGLRPYRTQTNVLLALLEAHPPLRP